MKNMVLCLAFTCLAVVSVKGKHLLGNQSALAGSILIQPQSKSVCEGLCTSFSVTVDGEVSSYQWKVDVGFGYWILATGQTFSDVDKAELKVNPVSVQMDNYRFKCLIHFSDGSVLETEPVSLHVLLKPEILTQPLDLLVCDHTGAVFSVDARGANLNYQWQENKNDGQGYLDLENGSRYSGTNTKVLTIGNPSVDMDQYTYRCVVGGECEGAAKVLSASATLSVNPGIQLLSNPQDAYACMALPSDQRSVKFKVEASGENLSYQWQVDAGFGFVSPPATPIHDGINSSELTVSGITHDFDGYVYRCLVFSSCGQTTVSGAAVLKVSDGNPAGPGPFVVKAEQVIVGTEVNYSIASVPGASSYNWYFKDTQGNTVPGVTIYGNGSNAVLLNFGSNASSGTLSVSVVNGCGISAPQSMAVSVSNSGTLPVNLISFDVSLSRAGNALLAWETAFETNNDHFDIEHSINGKDFFKIGEVLAKENSTSLQTYQFEHRKLASGTNYYRLSQLDKNGKSKELGIRSVFLAIPAVQPSVYPNPLMGSTLYVALEDPEVLTEQVSLSDLNGRCILNERVSVSNGRLEITLPEKLQPGIYMVRLGGGKLAGKLFVN